MLQYEAELEIDFRLRFFMPHDPDERLRGALTEVLASATGGRILLSQLGVALRRGLPGFSAQAFGHESLRALAAAYPDVGRLARGAVPQEWWFIRPDVAREDGVEGAQSQTSERSRQGDRLRREWWEAFASRHGDAGRTWFDLATLRLTTDAASIAAEPERFLVIPAVDLRRVAVEWVQRLAPSWAAEADRTLAGDEWIEAFEALLASTGQLVGFKRSRNHVVVGHALRWARDHGIDESMLVEPRRGVREESRRSPNGSLRAILHRLLDLMTDDEIEQISVPVHLLMRHLRPES